MFKEKYAAGSLEKSVNLRDTHMQNNSLGSEFSEFIEEAKKRDATPSQTERSPNFGFTQSAAFEVAFN